MLTQNKIALFLVLVVASVLSEQTLDKRQAGVTLSPVQINATLPPFRQELNATKGTTSPSSVKRQVDPIAAPLCRPPGLFLPPWLIGLPPCPILSQLEQSTVSPQINEQMNVTQGPFEQTSVSPPPGEASVAKRQVDLPLILPPVPTPQPAMITEIPEMTTFQPPVSPPEEQKTSPEPGNAGSKRQAGLPEVPTLSPELKEKLNVTQGPFEQTSVSPPPGEASVAKRQVDLPLILPPVPTQEPPVIAEIPEMTTLQPPVSPPPSTPAAKVRRQDGQEFYGGFRQRPRWCRYNPCNFATCPGHPRTRCYVNWRLCLPVFVNPRGYVIQCIPGGRY